MTGAVRRLAPTDGPPIIRMDQPTKVWAALLVGGIPRFIDQTIRPKLASFNIAIAAHWEQTRPLQGDIPAECEIVILLIDVTADGKTVFDRLKAKAEARQLPFISTQRQLTSIMRDLERHGFKMQRPAIAQAVVREHPMPPPLPPPVLELMKEPTMGAQNLASVPPTLPEALPTEWPDQVRHLKLLLKAMKKNGLEEFMYSGGEFNLKRSIVEESGGNLDE